MSLTFNTNNKTNWWDKPAPITNNRMPPYGSNTMYKPMITPMRPITQLPPIFNQVYKSCNCGK